MRRLIATASVAAAAALSAAGVAGAAQPSAAGPQTMVLNCGGQALTILTAPAVGTQDKENVDVWGAGRIVAGGAGHLIPVAFGFTAYDDTIGLQLFGSTDTKGEGNNAHNAQTVQCTQSETGTLADVFQTDTLPPELAGTGAQLSDQVTLTFTVTAVAKP
jgi:hypothetical protein